MKKILGFLGIISIIAIIFFGIGLFQRDKNFNIAKPSNKTNVVTVSPSVSPTTLQGEGVKAYVVFSSYFFKPSNLTVQPGTTIVFLNNDTASHSVINETFNSGPIPPIGSFSNKFEGKGTYKYYFADNKEISGVITVQ